VLKLQEVCGKDSFEGLKAPCSGREADERVIDDKEVE
jgi:hypothetical protein